MRIQQSVFPVLVILFPVFLAGCGVFKKAEPPRPCPPVFVVKQASFLTEYRNNVPGDITDVVFQNKISDFQGVCSFDKKRNRMNVTLSVIFDMLRGPANQTRKGSFAYFVAIPKFHPSPFGKQIFGVSVNFAENQTRQRAVDTVELEIPLKKGVPLKDYAIYVGFQLTPDQVDENRRALQR